MNLFIDGELPTKKTSRLHLLERIHLQAGEQIPQGKIEELQKSKPGVEIKNYISSIYDETVSIDFYFEDEESDDSFKARIQSAKVRKIREIVGAISRYNLYLSNIKEIAVLSEEVGDSLVDWQELALKEFLKQEDIQSQLDKARKEGYKEGYNKAQKEILRKIDENLRSSE